MKSLKPSMRERKRYLLLKGKDLDKNVPKAIKEFLGTLGLAKSSPLFIKTNSESAIISINRSSLDYVKAALSVWPEKIEVLRVSGTLKGLKKPKKKS